MSVFPWTYWWLTFLDFYFLHHHLWLNSATSGPRCWWENGCHFLNSWDLLMWLKCLCWLSYIINVLSCPSPHSLLLSLTGKFQDITEPKACPLSLSNAVFRCFLVSHSNARVLRNLETHREISASCVEKKFPAFSRINSVGRCLIVWSMMEVVGQENR